MYYRFRNYIIRYNWDTQSCTVYYRVRQPLIKVPYSSHTQLGHTQCRIKVGAIDAAALGPFKK